MKEEVLGLIPGQPILSGIIAALAYYLIGVWVSIMIHSQGRLLVGRDIVSGAVPEPLYRKMWRNQYFVFPLLWPILLVALVISTAIRVIRLLFVLAILAVTVTGCAVSAYPGAGYWYEDPATGSARYSPAQCCRGTYYPHGAVRR